MPYIRKIAIFLLFLSLACILGVTFMRTKAMPSDYWKWAVYGCCFIAFISSLIIVFFRQESSEALRLKYRARKMQEDEEKLLQLQKAYQAKVNVLADKEMEVKQKLMQYRQYAEFPDEQTAEVGNKAFFDDEVAELLHDKAEMIFDKIINKKYIEKKDFKHELLLADIADLVDSVARIHHPDSQHPLLETSIENLLGSLNRVSLQLLVLIDSFPINIKEYNLRKTYLYIQKSAATIGYYKKAEPFLTFAGPMLRIGLAANPLVGVAQTVALEAGKHAIKAGSEKYALNLLHDVIEIIGEQASTIFGENALRHRSEHWVYAVELTELMHHFSPAEPAALSKAMKIISGLLLRSEYDRIFIYHCLAQNKSAGPERFSNDFFTGKDRQELVSKLRDFAENTVNKNRTEEKDRKVISWRKKAEQRLGLKISLNIDANDSESLKNLLSPGSPEKKIKPFLARTILAMMEEDETPQFIYTDIHIEDSIQSAKTKQLWLISSARRLILLDISNSDKIHCVWRYDSKQKQPLSLQRISKVVADDCMVTGGSWQAELKSDSKSAFIIEGRKVGSYDSYFRILADFKRTFSAPGSYE